MHTSTKDDMAEGLVDGAGNSPTGIYGWRKRCLYLLVLLLLVIILVNLGLTIWIMVVLDFNIHGIGDLRITGNGVRLEGRAEFVDTLYAEKISSEVNSSLNLMSQQSLQLTAGGVEEGEGEGGGGTSRIQLGQDDINIAAGTINVRSKSQTSDDPILSFTDRQMTVGASVLQAKGPLGVQLEGPVEASTVQSPPNEQLDLVAPSGRLNIMGSERVDIEAGFLGSVGITSFGDITLQSTNGSIVLNAKDVVMQGLPVSAPLAEGKLWPEVYEVCACYSGKLFLAPGGGNGCHVDTSAVCQ